MAGKLFDGVVVSNKMEKTLVVSVTRQFKERRTGKIVSSRKKFKIHCEAEGVGEGDKVRFTECRPYSKDKRHRFIKLLRKVETAEEASTDELES